MTNRNQGELLACLNIWEQLEIHSQQKKKKKTLYMKSLEKAGKFSKEKGDNVCFYPAKDERASEPLPESIKPCNNGHREA